MNLGLSGQKRKELQYALIDAFPSKASLEQMLAFELDKNLDEIATDTNLQNIVFNLIKIASAENWIDNLISAACKSNPGNPRLKAVSEAVKLNKVSVRTDLNSHYEQDRNGQLDKKRSAFSIIGSTEQNPITVAKLKAIVANLREVTGDASLQIVDIEEGSIRLILEGSQAGLERVKELFKSGELTEVLDIPVEDVSFVDTGTSKDDKKRLAFTIAENATAADIKNLKVALIETSNQENTEDDDKSLLVQKILKNRSVGLDLTGADLTGADLTGAVLGAAFGALNAALSPVLSPVLPVFGAVLGAAFGAFDGGANLISAILTGANLSRANLISAKLISAKLISAKLISANLSRAKLSRANLSRADLSRANLSRANLSRANLSRANLSRANLTGAILTGANVENARFGNNPGISEEVKLDLIQRGAIFEDSPGDRSEILVPR